MSFLKQMLSPFIEFDDDKKKESGKQTPLPSAIPVAKNIVHSVDQPPKHPMITDDTSPVYTTQVPTYAPTGTIAGPFPEHERYFESLIDEANANNPLFRGSDFKEFVDGKLNIDGITDEALKYRTAFNIFKSSGLTKEKLLTTGQEYLEIIGRDLNNFQGAHALLYKKDLGQHEILLQKKAQEMQEIMQKVSGLKKEIDKLTMDINITKEKLDTVRNSFLLAGERKQAEIQEELGRIARYF